MAFPSGEMDRAAGGADRIPVVRFTTAGLPAGGRFAAWSRATSALFDLCAPHPRRGMAGFSASLTAYHFGAFLLCHSRADAAGYIRSAQRSRLDDLDHYLIHLPLQQAGGFSGGFGGGVARRLRPMDVGIFDLALPSAYIAGAGETISLIVPRAGLSLLRAMSLGRASSSFASSARIFGLSRGISSPLTPPSKTHLCSLAHGLRAMTSPARP